MNVTANKGDTVTLELKVAREGVPVDLSGDTRLWFTAKRRRSDPDSGAVIRKGSSATGLNGIGITDAVGGVAQIVVDPVDSAALEPGTVFLVYDVQMREPTGIVTTLASGKFVYVDDVTDSA